MNNKLIVIFLGLLSFGCDSTQKNDDSKVVYEQVPFCYSDLGAAKLLVGFKLDSPSKLDSIQEIYGKLRRWDINPNFADGNWMMEDSVEYFVATNVNLVFKIRRINDLDFLDLGYWQIIDVDQIQTTPDFISEFLSRNELKCDLDPD
jgi:hypothetical protein